MELWNKYITYHPEIISRLELIKPTSRNKFLKKMKKEKDKSNFSSTLTELSFYEFFEKRGFQVEYDKAYRKFTPDITISKNDSQAIVEVVRLNPTKKDTIRNEFENYLLEEIENIKIGCWVEMHFKVEYFNVSLYDIQKELMEFQYNCETFNKLTYLKLVRK